jgi:hypothetical protein
MNKETVEVLEKTVESENEMREWLVNYVGDKHQPDDGNVTVAMIVEQMAEDFPEFVLAVAEENWVRGYQQGISDTHQGMEMSEQEEQSVELEDE